VRNQRGQVQQAETARAKRAAANNPALGGAPAASSKGAFGQSVDSAEPEAPVNRAERRAQGKKGR